MKIEGKKIEGPNVETLVIPRGDDREDIVFKARAILSYEDFDRICPRPTPPTVMIRGGERKEDLEDPAYKQRLNDYAIKRVAWIIVKSLEATPGLEWETVDLGDPNTWVNFETEFTSAGFTMVEIGRIRQAVYAANCLSDEKLEEARKSFLAGRVKLLERSFSQEAGSSDTQFGELANVSASGPQMSPTDGKIATSGSKPA